MGRGDGPQLGEKLPQGLLGAVLAAPQQGAPLQVVDHRQVTMSLVAADLVDADPVQWSASAAGQSVGNGSLDDRRHALPIEVEVAGRLAPVQMPCQRGHSTSLGPPLVVETVQTTKDSPSGVLLSICRSSLGPLKPSQGPSHFWERSLSSGMSASFCPWFLVSLFTESSFLLLVVFYLFFNYLSGAVFMRSKRFGCAVFMRNTSV